MVYEYAYKTYEYISKLANWSCIRSRQPAPDPHGSRTSSQLSVIRWLLNLPLNLDLALPLP